jgi:E1A-binding protein p400
MSRTQEALKSGHFVSVLSVLMRLQRICNHPGLVEPRLPGSSYAAGSLQYRSASLILKALEREFWKVGGGFRKPNHYLKSL